MLVAVTFVSTQRPAQAQSIDAGQADGGGSKPQSISPDFWPQDMPIDQNMLIDDSKLFTESWLVDDDGRVVGSKPLSVSEWSMRQQQLAGQISDAGSGAFIQERQSQYEAWLSDGGVELASPGVFKQTGGSSQTPFSSFSPENNPFDTALSESLN